MERQTGPDHKTAVLGIELIDIALRKLVAVRRRIAGSEDAAPPGVLRFTDSRDAEDFSEQERCQKCRREGIDNRFIGERQTVKPFRFVRNDPV